MVYSKVPKKVTPKTLWNKLFGKEKWITYLMLTPSVVALLTFSIYPLLWAVRYAFTEYSGFGTPEFVGLSNFVRVFTRDTDYWDSVVNTAIFAGGKLILTIPLAFFLAVLLNRNLPGKSFFRACFFLPTVVSTAVMSLVFYFVFNSYNGIVNQLLLQFNLIQEPISWFGIDLAMLTCIIVAAWGGIGNYMIYFLAGLQSIPQDIYDSAKIDGANAVQQVFSITLPMMSSVIQIVNMLAILAALKGYESIMILTSGGPVGTTEVMFLYAYKLLFPVSVGDAVTVQVGYGAAVSLVNALIVGVLTALYLVLTKKQDNN